MTWWKAAGIRAIKTVAQTAIATIGTSAILSDVNWIAVLSASALAGVLSLLTSVAGLPEVDSKKNSWEYTAEDLRAVALEMDEEERERFLDKYLVEIVEDK